ncbi:MAG: DUF3277 family protein [Puniceicoccales bacterium]|nr:DUF3277 family protein [Puniceicoccales bacterium]
MNVLKLGSVIFSGLIFSLWGVGNELNSVLKEDVTESILSSVEKSQPKNTKEGKPGRRGQMLAYLKTGPFPKMLNDVLKILNQAAPSWSSNLVLVTMGLLGGPDCPGLSTQDGTGVFAFPTLKGGCSFVWIFKAQPDAHLVKILKSLPQTVCESIEGEWFFACGDADVAKGIRPQVPQLLDFVRSPQETDINLQIFDGIWTGDPEDKDWVHPDVARQFNFCTALKPILEEVAGCGLAVRLGDPLGRLSFTLNARPNTVLAEYLSHPCPEIPVKADVPSDGACYRSIDRWDLYSGVNFLMKQAKRVKEAIGKMPEAHRPSWSPAVDFMVDKSGEMDPHLRLWNQYSDGYSVGCDWFNWTPKKEIKGRSMGVHAGRWPEKEGNEFLQTVFKILIPQCISEGTVLMKEMEKKSLKSSGEAESKPKEWEPWSKILRGIQCEYREKVFEKRGVSINEWAVTCFVPDKTVVESSSSKKEEPGSPPAVILPEKMTVVFDEHLFVWIAQGNILSASRLEDLEPLLTSVFGKEGKGEKDSDAPIAKTILRAGCVFEKEIDLKAIYETFFRLPSTASHVPLFPPATVKIRLWKRPLQGELEVECEFKVLLQLMTEAMCKLSEGSSLPFSTS